ncbi:hypothetical protein U9M48_006962 [Paspalum notatum var. saurae]|uniref:Uncharacterized protein n=1 Tax=Paspalum notatum var. saurae TaxID=547442 RepID=A0AAQ3PUF1_PASNO
MDETESGDSRQHKGAEALGSAAPRRDPDKAALRDLIADPAAGCRHEPLPHEGRPKDAAPRQAYVPPRARVVHAAIVRRGRRNVHVRPTTTAAAPAPASTTGGCCGLWEIGSSSRLLDITGAVFSLGKTVVSIPGSTQGSRPLLPICRSP